MLGRRPPSLRRHVPSMRHLAGAAVAGHAGQEPANVVDVPFAADAEHRRHVERCQRAVTVATQGPTDLIRHSVRPRLLVAGRSYLSHTLLDLLLDRRALGVESVELSAQLAKACREVENALHGVAHVLNEDVSASNQVTCDMDQVTLAVFYCQCVSGRDIHALNRDTHVMTRDIDALNRDIRALTQGTCVSSECTHVLSRDMLVESYCGFTSSPTTSARADSHAERISWYSSYFVSSSRGEG